MMKTSVRKIAAALTVAAISGSFSVYAEINEESTIQFSAYKVAAGTEDRVSAGFSTTFANVDLASGSWINNLLRGGTTSSYNGGAYLYSQGDNTAESITVTLSGVASGYYTLKQFDVAAASSALDITISSGNESYEYTTAPTQSGEFVELGTELLLGGEVTIVYRAASAAAIRLDETQLVMTEQTEPSVTDEPSATEPPSPTPDTSTPAPTIDPGDIPEDLSPSKVRDVQLTGQLVEADGLEGLAVDGTCEVTYKFESENGENDNGALIRWYRALTKDGEYTEIDGSTGSPYTIKEELGGYYVKAGVSVLTDKDTVTEEIFTDPIQVKYKLAFYDDFDYTATSGEDPAFIEHGWTSDKSIRVLGSPTVYCARVPENITVEDGLLIPSSVKNIEDGAFSLCPKLEKVTFNGNAPEETGRFIFGDDNNVTVYFYKGAQGFTTPEWNGYSAVEMDGEPIPIPEPVLTSIELTGGRDSAVRGFTLTPFTARAYDDIGDEITDIDFVWSVTGNATVDNGIVTISENAKNGETVIVKAEGTYNGKTMSAEKTITIGDTLKFSFGSEYIKIKSFLPGSMAETAIADTGITTTVTVSKSTNYSNVEIMNRDTKAQSGYYPFKDGLPGDFYYLFISGEGKNELKLPYTVRAGETIRIKFAKPYATNNGTKNRSEVNNKLDLTIGSETYSLKDNCDFDTWYTKDFVVDADTNMMTISMGTWSAITIESIEILVNGSDEEPIETGFSSVEYHDGTAEVEFYAPGGVLLIAAYDTDGRLLKTALCQSSEWTKDGEIRRLPFHIRCFRQ